LLRGAMDLGQDVLGKGRRGPEMASVDTHYSRLGSILVDVVDIEVVQAASRAVAAKIRRVGADPGLVQQRRDLGVVPLTHRLLDAVRTEAGNLAAHVQPRLVDRVAEMMTGVTTDYEHPGLRHERAHVPCRTGDDDVHALHGDPAARTGVTVDHQQSA